MAGVVPPEEATGEVPVTEVTVPLPVPAPIAVLNVAASRVDTVLSALMRTKVIALGLVRVKKFDPTVVAPRFVRAVAAVVAPVPPLAIATVPVTFAAVPLTLPVIVLGNVQEPLAVAVVPLVEPITIVVVDPERPFAPMLIVLVKPVVSAPD